MRLKILLILAEKLVVDSQETTEKPAETASIEHVENELAEVSEPEKNRSGFDRT